MPENVPRICATCRAYDKTGECHLYPPTRLPRAFADGATARSRVRDEEITWGWPRVEEWDWCLDWADKRALS